MSATLEGILDYLDGRLSAAERERFEARLARDESFRALVAQCRSLLEALREGELPAASSGVVESAVRLMRDRDRGAGRDRAQRTGGSTPSETVAALIFDSLAAGDALAGVRGTSVSRRLRYASGVVELDLEIDVLGHRVVLRGDAMEPGPEPRPLAGASGALLRSDGEVARFTTDALGAFVVTTVAGVPTALRLDLRPRAIRFDLPGDPGDRRA